MFFWYSRTETISHVRTNSSSCASDVQSVIIYVPYGSPKSIDWGGLKSEWMSMTAKVPPGPRSLWASRSMFSRPAFGASWNAYIMVTRSNDFPGKDVLSAFPHANVAAVHALDNFALALWKLWVNGLTMFRWLERNWAIDIISTDVSRPITDSASGNASIKARVDVPTPQHRSSIRALLALTFLDSSSATFARDRSKERCRSQ